MPVIDIDYMKASKKRTEKVITPNYIQTSYSIGKSFKSETLITISRVSFTRDTSRDGDERERRYVRSSVALLLSECGIRKYFLFVCLSLSRHATLSFCGYVGSDALPSQARSAQERGGQCSSVLPLTCYAPTKWGLRGGEQGLFVDAVFIFVFLLSLLFGQRINPFLSILLLLAKEEANLNQFCLMFYLYFYSTGIYSFTAFISLFFLGDPLFLAE
eukprot:gene12179-8380_t